MKRYAWPGMALAGLLALSTNCINAGRVSKITPGAVKRHVEKGVTTQDEVIEVFGTPNIVTMKEPYEMWVYDRVSSRLAAGFGLVSRSETTVMLIVYFDEDEVVADYRLAQAKF